MSYLWMNLFLGAWAVFTGALCLHEMRATRRDEEDYRLRERVRANYLRTGETK